MDEPRGLAGETVAFAGRLLTMTRRQAAALVAALGGTVAPDLSDAVTLLIVGADAPAESPPGGAESGGRADTDVERKLRRAAEAGRVRVMSEDEFCACAGRITPTLLRQQYYSHAAIRSLYPAVGDEHLRYLEKWGLLRSVVRTPGETYYGFGDLAVIRQASAELEQGASVKAVLRALVAAREGQLAFDFQARQGEPSPNRVVPLARRAPAPRERRGAGEEAGIQAVDPVAERLFFEAARLDTGDADRRSAAMIAYRRALLAAPALVPALVNLGNLHYAEDHFPEAHALYLQATLLDPDCFEAHYNLGNLLHDLGRFGEAEVCYREALRIDPTFADAHFYLAVALEKQGRSAEARPHWKRYQELAPDGDWIELAREFTE
jgi:tetratricopeptide (TPR) repeat protein